MLAETEFTISKISACVHIADVVLRLVAFVSRVWKRELILVTLFVDGLRQTRSGHSGHPLSSVQPGLRYR